MFHDHLEHWSSDFPQKCFHFSDYGLNIMWCPTQTFNLHIKAIQQHSFMNLTFSINQKWGWFACQCIKIVLPTVMHRIIINGYFVRKLWWKLNGITVYHTVLSFTSVEPDGYLPLNIITCVYFFCRFYRFLSEGLMESVNV